MSAQDSVTWALTNGSGFRCYLGGSDILNDSIPGTAVHGRFLGGVTSANATGTHARRRTRATRSATGCRGQALCPRASLPRGCGRGNVPGDAEYLWPINRTLNPNFKGVIFVTGKVAISGVLRGQITLAATDNIVIADDVTYATNPGLAVPCNSVNRDMLGLFSGTDIVVADNLIDNPYPAISGGANRTWDDTPERTIHGVLLALSNFTVESWIPADQRRSVRHHGQGTRLPGPDGWRHPAAARCGRYRRWYGKPEAVLVRRVRGDQPAAVFPDDGPLRGGALLRDRADGVQHRHVLAVAGSRSP